MYGKNSNLSSFKFETNSFTGVTTEYSNNNVLRIGGKDVCPSLYPNSVFLVVLNSSQAVGKSTMYSVIVGSTATSDGVTVIRLDASEGTPIPQLDRTASGRVYVKWSSSTALIRASIFKII